MEEAIRFCTQLSVLVEVHRSKAPTPIVHRRTAGSGLPLGLDDEDDEDDLTPESKAEI